MSAPSLSRRAFGALVGVSSTVIQRLVRRGLLPIDGEGKIPQREGLAAYLALRTVKGTATPPAPAGERGEPATNAARTPAPHRHAEVIELETERRRLAIEGQKLRLGRDRGELVRREDVRREGQAVGTAIRNALLAIPDRVALLLEAALAADGPLRAARIRRLVADEINSALTALHAWHSGPDDAEHVPAEAQKP